ncbi:MAG TPA: hypothetical protein VKQ30_25195 [Ktedonobacterales bacterium]|nr:hypothetical protein [Ktedonobacterales bacterium]
MTNEQLNEIRERAAKATPGPWSCWNGWQYDRETDTMAMQGIGPDGGYGKALATRDGHDIYATRADAEFVACSREDIPALLAEVERLRTENEALMLAGRGTAQMATGAYERLQRLQAKNAAMREIVQAVAHDCTVALWPAENGGNDHREPWCAACLCIQAGDMRVHTSDCPVTKARAWLAAQASDTPE